MINKYLEEAPLTKVTPQIKSIASKINGEGLDYLFNASNWINSILFKDFKYINSKTNPELIEKEHQKRSADEIIQSKYFFGCSDLVIIFCTICKAKGIAVKYIQCVDVASFSKNRNFINGHTYCECYVDESTYLFEVNEGLMIKINSEKDKLHLYKIKDWQLMIEAFSGIDPVEAGVRSNQEMLERMIETANKFLKNSRI